MLPRQIEHRFTELGALVGEYEWSKDAAMQSRESLNILFGKAYEIWELAKDCKNRDVPEPQWNEDVHCQILRLALDRRANNALVRHANITTAQITDKSLLATMGSISVQSKLVDYALFINDKSLKPRIIAKLMEVAKVAPGATINCTSAEYMRFDPIAISIETKRESSPSSATQFLQLGTWMTAHFLRLKQLTPPGTTLPTIPALVAEGHEWKFMLVRWDAGKEKGDLDGLTILDSLLLGSTSSIVGIYRVIAAVRRLAKWVQEDYRPWFETHVLN